MSQETYAVKGMHCQGCVANVTESVAGVGGVAAVEVDLDSEKVVVKGEGFDDSAVREAIAAAGYRAA